MILLSCTNLPRLSKQLQLKNSIQTGAKNRLQIGQRDFFICQDLNFTKFSSAILNEQIKKLMLEKEWSKEKISFRYIFEIKESEHA